MSRSLASTASSIAGGASATRPSATGGRGVVPMPAAERKRRAWAGSTEGWSGSPQPHHRIAGAPSRSATDPLETIEGTVDRCGRRAPHHEAAEPGEEARERLAKLDRDYRLCPAGEAGLSPRPLA